MAMAKPQVDLTKLTPTQLLRLVNNTPIGAVLSRSRLRRQMDAAALRFGDGKRIHSTRYARWLIAEHDRPRSEPMDYDQAKARQARRNRAATKAAQDIAPIPDIANMRRRKAACKSLRKFCETYFRSAFFWKWSPHHLKVITKLERAVTDGGLFAFAMPRGGGKTTLARCAAIWAILTGHRKFVCLIGGTRERATGLMDPIKTHMLENPLLLADFPEAVYPLRALENSSKRQKQQHCRGKLTHVHWGDLKLVFPTLSDDELPKGLDENPSGGSIITVTSLDSDFKGQQHTRTDGTVIRPSLVLLDDPQTRQSAQSPKQTKYRMQLLNGDVLGLAGPGERIAAFMPCTKIYENDLSDQMLDRDKNPEWQGECTKMLESLPTNDKHWDKYDEIRKDGLRRELTNHPETSYYRRHHKVMDAGAKATWPLRYTRGVEISAIQHAMNLKLRNAEAFFAEYQNDPMSEQVADDVVTVQQVIEKTSGRARGAVPLAAGRVTAFIDVHDKLLYFCVVGWEDDFNGYIVDYGAFPDQKRPWFALRDARTTLRMKFPGKGDDGAIMAGLSELVAEMLSKTWPRTGGGLLRIDRLLVDMGYKPEIIGAVKHKVGGETMMLSRGVGIRAGNRPMSQYRRKAGERYGHHWYTPTVRGTQEFPHIAVDVNYWKSYVHQALATPLGETGCVSLYGSDKTNHELFAEHIAGSEFWKETFGYGRTVHEWYQKPNRPDNHWLDCLVGCAAAASFEGVATDAMKSNSLRRRKKYSQKDMKRR